MPQPDHDTHADYSDVAEEYSTRFIDELDHKPFDRQVLNDFADRVRGQGLVCDLGCGGGQIARYLVQRGVRALGMDLSPAMVKAAQQLNPSIRFEQGDMQALPVADNAWAGIAAFYSIIHVPRQQVTAALAEMRRALHAGGLLLLAFHIGEEVVHIDEWWDKPVDLDFYFFTREELEGYLHEAGFEIERSLERAPYVEVEHPSQRGYILAKKPGESSPGN